MLGGKYDATFDFGFAYSREYGREVEDKLRGGVRYDGKIRVVTLRYIFRKLDVESLLFHFSHIQNVF